MKRMRCILALILATALCAAPLSSEARGHHGGVFIGGVWYPYPYAYPYYPPYYAYPYYPPPRYYAYPPPYAYAPPPYPYYPPAYPYAGVGVGVHIH